VTPLYFGASSRIIYAETITLPIGWAITTPAWRADYERLMRVERDINEVKAKVGLI